MTVDAHRGLEQAEAASGAPVHEVRREREARVVGADPDVDGDPLLPQLRDAARPAHVRIGILERDDDPGDARLDQRLGARRRAPLVRAGLERDVGGRAAGAVAGRARGPRLRRARRRGAAWRPPRPPRRRGRSRIRPTGWAACGAGRVRARARARPISSRSLLIRAGPLRPPRRRERTKADGAARTTGSTDLSS